MTPKDPNWQDAANWQSTDGGIDSEFWRTVRPESRPKGLQQMHIPAKRKRVPNARQCKSSPPKGV